jgi:hypothetical protein
MHTKDNEWSNEEFARLRKLYPTTDYRELRRAFPNRTPVSLQHAATKLGLKRQLAANGRTAVLAHLTEADRGYIAGIIDGEGCIHFARRNAFSRPSGRSESKSFSIAVQVTQIDGRLISWLQEKIAGVGSVATYNRAKQKHVLYQWTLRSSAAQIFLREIAPYLVIKREQAEALANGYKHLPDAQREALYEKLRHLKRSACTPVSPPS